MVDEHSPDFTRDRDDPRRPRPQRGEPSRRADALFNFKLVSISLGFFPSLSGSLPKPFGLFPKPFGLPNLPDAAAKPKFNVNAQARDAWLHQERIVSRTGKKPRCKRTSSSRAWISTPDACAPRLRKGGGAEEDRTPDPLRARQVLSQLSYGPKGHTLFVDGGLVLVGLDGLEPPTSPLSGVRSHQAELQTLTAPQSRAHRRLEEVKTRHSCERSRL